MLTAPIGRLTQNTSAERRADHRRDAEHARHVALDPRPLGRRVDVADDGAGDRLDGAGADPLHRAKHHQHDHAAGETAQCRADQKNAGADKKDALAAVEVGEPAVDRHGHRHRQQIGREHPAEKAEPAEVADDRRHRGGDDAAFHRRHKRRDQRRRQHHAAARNHDRGPVQLRQGLIQTAPPPWAKACFYCMPMPRDNAQPVASAEGLACASPGYRSRLA
jgi:hypothetical protein